MVDRVKSLQGFLSCNQPTIRAAVALPLTPTSSSEQASIASTMPRPMPALMLIFLFLLFQTFSSQVRGIDDRIKSGYVVSKCLDTQMHARKFLGEITLDYDDGGPNTKHDPRKGKPGNGGKNP